MKRAVLAAAALLPGLALAQSFPSKPMRIVVPFSPGSIMDTVARFASIRAAEELGQPAVVENRAGAGGRIGSEQVSKSPADGHVIMLGSVGTHVGVVFLSKVQSYDPLKDFTPISLAVEPLSGLVVNPSLPVSSMKELIEYSKRNPGKLSYATNGIGTSFHLAGELLKSAGGFDMLHVPMKGAGEVSNQVVGGHVPLGFMSASQIMPLVAAGKVRLLGITTRVSGSRYPAPSLPDAVPGFEYPGSWFGFFGPPGLPAPILSRWNAVVVHGLTAPDVRAKLEEGGIQVVASSPQELAQTVQRGLASFGRAVKLAGIEPE